MIMLDVKQCKSCFEIKQSENFEVVKTGEEFVPELVGGEIKYKLKSFFDVLCSECIGRIELKWLALKDYQK